LSLRCPVKNVPLQIYTLVDPPFLAKGRGKVWDLRKSGALLPSSQRASSKPTGSWRRMTSLPFHEGGGVEKELQKDISKGQGIWGFGAVSAGGKSPLVCPNFQGRGREGSRKGGNRLRSAFSAFERRSSTCSEPRADQEQGGGDKSRGSGEGRDPTRESCCRPFPPLEGPTALREEGTVKAEG